MSSRARRLGAAVVAVVVAVLTVGLARGRTHLPPARVVCAVARPAADGVDVPAGARVVSAGPGEGRPWACYVAAVTP